MASLPEFIKRNPSIALILVAAIIFVTIGYFLKEITFVDGILLILFSSITAISFHKLFQMVTSGRDVLGIERSLPSIDGSVSGWRLTSSLSMLIITCLFGLLTLFVLSHSVNDTPKDLAGKMNSAQIDSVLRARLDSMMRKVKDSIKVDKKDSQKVN